MRGRHRRRNKVAAFAAAVAAVALAGCGQSATSPTATTSASGAPTTTSPATLHAVATPRRKPVQRPAGASRRNAAGLASSTASAQIVQAQPAPGSCHAIGSGLYSRPDPRCTPGALNPAVTQATIGQTICTRGWTDTVRPPESVTEPEKQASIAAYGDQGPLSEYEYDHFVPLETGGAVNDPRNLWPEPGASPNPKDAVEDELNQKVCDGEMTLAQAQHAIVANWTGLAAPAPAPSSPTSPPSTTRAPAPSARAAQCTLNASYSSTYHDYDVYVHSNQPDETVTATDTEGHSDSWHTNSTGYADVYFHAGGDAGQAVTVHVGGASCSTTL